MADSTPEAPLADNAIGVPVSRAKTEPYGMDFECMIYPNEPKQPLFIVIKGDNDPSRQTSALLSLKEFVKTSLTG